MKTLFYLFVILFLISAAVSSLTPSGIGPGPNDISVAHVEATKEKLNIPYLFLPLTELIITAIATNLETPIQFRLAMFVGTGMYNAVAMHNPKAVDTWGRSNRRLITDGLTEAELRAHETVTAAYAFAYFGFIIDPTLKDGIAKVMENMLGLPVSKLDGNPDPGTPWGLAKATVEESIAFGASDGWNADGSLTNMFNKMPYSDFDFVDNNGGAYRAYKTRKNRRSVRYNRFGRCRKTPNPWFWEPLLESNGFGYFTRQEHVTPFIGFTGRLMGLTESQYTSFSSPIPRYNFCKEADFVLKNTFKLATSDLQKMQVELFDNKFTSLLPLQIDWSIKSGFSELDFWFYDMALTVAMYDATMLVWRDKVLFNVVRPTTVVQNVKKNTKTRTFGGAFQGVQRVRGIDWQPYIRTMPHAEYPSGSSCVCTAFKEALVKLTGEDETGIPLVQKIAAGSSSTEPGVTPAVNLTMTFHKWSEVQKACGESREYGGMHFSQAVPAGQALCTGISEIIVSKAVKLKEGEPSARMAHFNDRTIRVKKKRYYM